MNKFYRTVSLFLSCVIGAFAPMTVWAKSPEFARTEQEWAALEDNRLEYDEIPELIHEYNTTVQDNQYDYNEFVKDYGTTKEDVSREYEDLAGELENEMSGDDSAASRVSDLQLSLQAKQLREQADDNLEDSHIYYLTYSQAEDNLAFSAQSKFISYYSSQLELESAKLEKQNLENDYNLLLTQRQAGMATDAQVLDGEEALLEQEKTISELEQDIEGNRQSLIIMLGWQGSDQPEIGELPEIDLEEIESIDLEEDKEKALENNYTLLINQRKLENADDKDNKDKIQNTIDGNKRQIEVSVTSAWQSLQTAKLSYEQAQADEITEERNTALAQQKWTAGMITQYEYEEQQSALEVKKLAVETSKLNLLEALETYKWTVNGLAAAE